MRYIGIITVIFEIITIYFLFSAYRSLKADRRLLKAAMVLCTISLIGMIILTVLNW